MIRFEVADKAVTTALVSLRDMVGETGMAPAMSAIGELLTESTKQRFVTSTAPDGSAWAPNAESTLLAVMRGKSKGGLRTRGGGTKSSAVRALANKRPLVASGQLARTIHYQLISGGVMVGTNRWSSIPSPIAAALHFGSKDGRIPGRPFLGVSMADQSAILQVIERHLSK